MKNAALYEEAKRLYINDGFSLDAIVSLLKNNVSRKTLFNWKQKNNWEKQKENYLKQNQDLQEEILEIAKVTIKEAKANPTPHNIYAVVKAISAMKLLQGVNLKEQAETEEKTKNISKETFEFVQKEILGM